MTRFGRIITAMITPFREDGSVDYEGAVSLAQYLIENGSEGLLLGGTTGEGAAMSAEEKLKLYAFVVDAVGQKSSGKRVPIMGNVGGIDTKASIAFLKEAEKTGVDSVLAIAPFYVKPTQEGMYRHFKAIADSTDLPVFLYNVPGRTVVNILPQTVKRLTEACPNIVGIKDATGNWEQLSEEKRILPEDFLVYSGDDSFTLPVLLAGGAGVVSVAAHVIGSDMLAMIHAFEEGRIEEARKLHLKMMPIMKGLFFITSPIPVKTAVNLMGLPGGAFRLPMVEASPEERAHIQSMLTDYGLL